MPEFDLMFVLLLFVALFCICQCEKPKKWSPFRDLCDWALLSVTSYLAYEFTRL